MERIPPEAFDRLLLDGRPLLDVRAEGEFASGTLPSSSNLPLLDDDERHQVGKRYKQAGAEAAVKLGHRLVSGTVRAERTGAWLRWAKAHPGGALYCWRGGQRSAIVQAWLAEEGCHVPRIAGGYKALRRHLLTVIDTLAGRLPLLVLGGRTGTGKTRLLGSIRRSLDLEGLAGHRGSAFGARAAGQPAPASFENALAIELLRLRDGGRVPVAVEDESRNIGRLSLPSELIANLGSAPLLLIERSLEERVSITLEDYIVAGLAERQACYGGEQGFAAYADWLRDAMHRIRKRLGGVRHRELSAMLETALAAQQHSGDPHAHRGWITRLLTEYYDPMYDYQLQAKRDRVLFEGPPEAVVDFVATQQQRAG